MPLHTQDIEAASRGNPTLRRVLNEFAEASKAHSVLLGVDPHNSQGIRQDQQLAPPKTGKLDVRGIDGHFYVTITPPLPGVNRTAATIPAHFESARGFRKGDPWGENDARASRMLDVKLLNDGRRLGRLLHELQSSRTLDFDAAGAVTKYGPSATVTYDELVPNEQRYWRFHSRYENSDFNDWIYYINPQVCGPVAVDSGLLRSTSASPNMSLNSDNDATVTSVDAGADATIRVYGSGGVGSPFNRFDGQGGTTPVPAGTILHQPYTTLIYVFYRASVGYVASASYTATLPDDALWAGSLTTCAAGGGGGTNGGGGGGGNGRNTR